MDAQVVRSSLVSFKCTGCHETKPITEFRFDAAKPRGFATRCKECSAKASSASWERNKRRRKDDIENKVLRVCTACQMAKSVTEFNADFRSGRGSASSCKPCHKLYFAKWQKRKLAGENTSPRSAELKRSFGLSETEFWGLFNQQNSGCAICGVEFEARLPNKKINVDHDHKTGKVRGLLCTPCNFGIGCFRDQPSLLMKAIGYLCSHSERDNDERCGHC